jgi:hypothetical protein
MDPFGNNFLSPNHFAKRTNSSSLTVKPDPIQHPSKVITRELPPAVDSSREKTQHDYPEVTLTAPDGVLVGTLFTSQQFPPSYDESEQMHGRAIECNDNSGSSSCEIDLGDGSVEPAPGGPLDSGPDAESSAAQLQKLAARVLALDVDQHAESVPSPVQSDHDRDADLLKM